VREAHIRNFAAARGAWRRFHYAPHGWRTTRARGLSGIRHLRTGGARRAKMLYDSGMMSRTGPRIGARVCGDDASTLRRQPLSLQEEK
jgi:hypothetical protein